MFPELIDCLLNHCLGNFIASRTNVAFSMVSIFVAALAIIYVRSQRGDAKKKIAATYLYLAALFFPIALFAVSSTCNMLLSNCDAKILLYSVPAAAGLAIISGFIFIPGLLLFRGARVADPSMVALVSKHSRMPVSVYSIETDKPSAFSFSSFRSAIFLSVGLSDVLTKKEREAVLLHEIAHINSRSSSLKVSSMLLRIFSPIAALGPDLDAEEKMADGFVVKTQGTRRHLLSAKRKINELLIS